MQDVQGITTEIIQFIQAICGNDKVIVQGFDSDVAPNWGQSTATDPKSLLIYKGELLEFTSSGDGSNLPNAQLCLRQRFTNAFYDIGLTIPLPVLKISDVVWSPPNFPGYVETLNLNEFVRLKSLKELSLFSMPDGVVVDPNYLAFTQAMLDKLNAIQAGAQVNVKPSWTAAPGSANEILNKPTILNVLKNESFIIGDFGNTDYEVPLVPPVSTSDYRVICSFETAASNAAATVDFNHIVHSKTVNSFKVRLKEPGNISQSLTINYLIITN
jgi:hypothetical protein